MNKAKKVFYTLAAGATMGMVLGIMFAPDKGAETRKKLRKLKAKFSHTDDGLSDNRKALEELSDVLKTELAIVNEKLESLS